MGLFTTRINITEATSFSNSKIEKETLKKKLHTSTSQMDRFSKLFQITEQQILPDL